MPNWWFGSPPEILIAASVLRRGFFGHTTIELRHTRSIVQRWCLVSSVTVKIKTGLALYGIAV